MGISSRLVSAGNRSAVVFGKTANLKRGV